MLTNTINVSLKCVKQHFRTFSNYKLKEKIKKQSKARAWQIHSYGDISELQLGTVRIPHLESPQDLIINVEAASINPIDLLMTGGYGKTILGILRQSEMELPLILGRDFSGTVVHKGFGVSNSFNVGDKVYGFLPLHKQGSLSEMIVAEESHICKQPPQMTAVETASLVYASMTAWSALYLTGGLLCKKNARVLILGASGGVGTCAVQLLKAHGIQVVGTCASDAVSLVQSLGADAVFDYKTSNYLENLALEGRYDVVLDCAKIGHDNIPNAVKYDNYVTLNSPLLHNTERLGLVGGVATSASDLIQANLKRFNERKFVKWGFFVHSGAVLGKIHQLICDGKIKPVIHKEFKFEDTSEAFLEVAKGHLRGKVVINFEENS